MKKAVIAILAAAGIVGGVTACGSSHGPSVSSCTQVMVRDIESNTPVKEKPAECNGLSDAQLKQVVGKVVVQVLSDGYDPSTWANQQDGIN